jgi:hypothetical protein
VGGFDGIAEVDDENNLHMVLTDPKAKNAADAVERITYVLLLARKQLLGERETPRKIWVDAMKEYGIYSGNARAQISRDKGIISTRTAMSLSNAKTPRAQEYVADIQNSELIGKWTPGKGRTRAKKKLAVDEAGRTNSGAPNAEVPES